MLFVGFFRLLSLQIVKCTHGSLYLKLLLHFWQWNLVSLRVCITNLFTFPAFEGLRQLGQFLFFRYQDVRQLSQKRSSHARHYFGLVGTFVQIEQVKCSFSCSTACECPISENYDESKRYCFDSTIN